MSQGPVLGDGSWKHLWVFSFLLSLCKSSWIVCSLEAEFFMCLVHFFLVFLFVCLFVCLFFYSAFIAQIKKWDSIYFAVVVNINRLFCGAINNPIQEEKTSFYVLFLKYIIVFTL